MGLLGKQQSFDPKVTDSSIRVRTGDLRDSDAERDDFALYVSKSVPQGTSGAKAVNRAVFFGTVENVVFITLGEPQAHGDTAEQAAEKCGF
jgi:hypothetical protein